MSILIILNFINILLSLGTGFLLQYVFKDLSKNSGFLITKKKQSMVIAHIFIGMIIGLLILPVRYNREKSQEESQKLPKSVIARQSVGLIIFLMYTIRNFWKHPRNLNKNLNNCQLGDNYSIFKSSITRQQMQLLLGISLSTIPTLFIIKKSKQKITNTSIVFLTITGLSWLQIIFQFINENKSNNILKKQYFDCMQNQ